MLSKQSILDIIKSRHWNIQSFNGMPLYLMCAATLSGWRVKDELGVGYSHFFYLFSKGRAHMYYDESDWRAIADAYYARITSEEALREMMNRHEDAYVAKYQDLQIPHLEMLENEELISLARTLCAKTTDSVGVAHALEGITFGSEERLKAALEKRGAFSTMDFSFLCSPIYSSFITNVQSALLTIQKMAEGVERDQAIASYIQKYIWAEATYQGVKKLTAEGVLSRARELTEITSVNTEVLLGQKEELMNKFAFTAEERFIVKTIEISFKWQDDRKMHILQSIAALDPVIDYVAQRFGIDPMAARFALPEELTVEQLTRKDFGEILNLRKEKSAYYAQPEQTAIFTGDDYTFFSTNLHMSFDEEVSEIKGVVASRGIARGIVRVCESVSSIDRVQTGEILVTSMTRPEYLPAMQRAAAFITDEGGITCHAAIISREMQKPCIIGTRHATKIFKDGDLVEVDAETGIIRRLTAAVT